MRENFSLFLHMMHESLKIFSQIFLHVMRFNDPPCILFDFVVMINQFLEGSYNRTKYFDQTLSNVVIYFWNRL